MAKMVKVGTACAELIADEIAKAFPSFRPFRNAIYQALKMYIELNRDRWLPEEVFAEELDKVIHRARQEEIDDILRKWVQEGRCAVFSKDGEDYYYVEKRVEGSEK
jgi:hypothetical protein